MKKMLAGFAFLGFMGASGAPAPAASPAVPAEFDLADDWSFMKLAPGEAFDPARLPETGWSEVALPHTANLEPRIVNDQWQGVAVYRRQLVADPQWRDRSVWLRFEGAMMVATVYLNGVRLAEHKGGYLPFTVDLSDQLRFGAANELVVRLDNTDNPITGPKPLEILDFNMYGGLYRGVGLSVRDRLHITDEMLADRVAGGGIFVTFPSVSSERADVAIKTHVANAGGSRRAFVVRHALMDGDKVVAEVLSDTVLLAPGADVDDSVVIFVPEPRLWSPKSPALYRLVTQIVEDGRIVDARRLRIGIRRIEFDGDGFRINGENMFLRGVNRHQEYPYVGYAVSPNADYRDAKLIKQGGFDYVRLSHYPHSPAFMDAADELGLVLLDAILGWQYSNPDPAFADHVVQTCRDLVRRDRNHPSVIAWECSLNETGMDPELIERLHAAAHEEYPGDRAYSAGWVPFTYDIYIQARQHRLPYGHDPVPDYPFIVSEYGDWEYYAENAGFNQDDWTDLAEAARSSRQLLADGEVRLLQQATNVQEAHNDNRSTAAFADGYWVMFDYNRGYADDLEASGVMSLERLPKPLYQFFRSQRDADEVSDLYAAGPMVFIANEWREGSPREVRVFSNGDEVELFLNGVSLGRQRPDQDRISTHLSHPPFTFETAEFVPGVLEAVAYTHGEVVARHVVRTPGEAASVEAILATEGVDPAADDVLFVHGRIVDAEGTTVPETGRTVRFMLPDGLQAIGPTTGLSENGWAATLVKVTDLENIGPLTAAVDRR